MIERYKKWGKCGGRDVKGEEVIVEKKVVMEENGKRDVKEVWIKMWRIEEDCLIYEEVER